MAAIYFSLDVPLEIAMIAVVVYRFVLHVFPFLTSTILYYPLFKEAKTLKVSEIPNRSFTPAKATTSNPGKVNQ